MADWPLVALGEIAAPDDAAIAIGPFGSRMKTDTYVDSGVGVIRGQNITDDGQLTGDFVYVSDDFASSLGAARLLPGDIVLPHRGAIGRAALVPEGDYVMSTSLMRIRLDKTRAFPAYVKACLCSDAGRQEILKFASTVGTPGIGQPLRSLRQMRVPLAPINEQRRIAGVLGTLDDLIDTNGQEAARLDTLCRALGQQFLIATADRPLARIDELATISKGYSYKSSELTAGNGWLVNLKNVGRDGRYQQEGLKPLTGNHKTVHVVDNGDICVAQTDLTQNREVIGRPIRVRRGSATGELVASLDLVIVRPTERSTREYLYAVLDSDEFRSHALGFCNGTTVLHMSSGAVPTFQAAIPEQEELSRFSDRVRILREEADRALIDAERLVQVRDELLPLLLSGRVRVEDVAA
jgi:type I restriction enzyme, S subunit